MNKVLILPAILVAGLFTTAQASSLTGLDDWCININGDISTACNGLGTGGSFGPAPGGVNLAAFDLTAEPSTNVLGQVVVNLSAGLNNQFSAFYADYDLDYATDGSFDDVAAIFNVGSLPSGASYEVEDPTAGIGCCDIANFSGASPFSDTNTVGAAQVSGPPFQCCDVSFGLGFSGLNVAAGGTGTITYTVSTTAPVSGFYIQQSNVANGDSLFLSAVVDIENPTGPTTPEPSTFVLGLGVIGIALLMRRKMLAGSVQ